MGRGIPRTTLSAWLHRVIFVNRLVFGSVQLAGLTLATRVTVFEDTLYAAATTTRPANVHQRPAPSFHHHTVPCPSHPCTDTIRKRDVAQTVTARGTARQIRRRVFHSRGADDEVGNNFHLALAWRDFLVCASYGGAIVSTFNIERNMSISTAKQRHHRLSV